MGSTLKEKNLLPEEQILFFESRSLLKREAKLLMLSCFPLIHSFTFILLIVGILEVGELLQCRV